MGGAQGTLSAGSKAGLTVELLLSLGSHKPLCQMMQGTLERSGKPISLLGKQCSSAIRAALIFEVLEEHSLWPLFPWPHQHLLSPDWQQ
jgi:hypothetical protein